MKATENFKFYFRKSPLFRTGTIIFSIVFVLAAVSVITYKARKIPEIDSVQPPVGSPGDIMIITGKNFGNMRTPSDYVEVGGSRITASGYLSWEDSQIKLILPSNVQDGLVVVATKDGVSQPGFFANEAGIPVEFPPDTKTSLPIITSVTPESQNYGGLLNISGTNFGAIRNNAKIYFSSVYKDNSKLENQSEQNFVCADESNYDYEYWSDSEIHVRIPEGADSGNIFIETEKGKSNFWALDIKNSVGTKTYSDKKTYSIQVSTDVLDSNSKNTAVISLRIPRPAVSAQQPLADLTECSPKPAFESYQNTIIHQFELAKSAKKTCRFQANFVIESYTVTTDIKSKNVRPFSDKQRVLYKTHTAPDSLIKSDDEDFVSLAKSIVKKETNPYLQARLIYDFMLDQYALEENLRKTGSPSKDLIEDKKGDAFDFAVVYTTLLRACGVPAIPVGGILVDSDLKTRNHWWCEFYIENLGWIPVDVVLGSGMEYKSFKPVENAREYYFGNLDGQHIAFSRGYNELKPSIVQSCTVYRERTYALQSIWEESSSEKVDYSSLWNDPVILGIY